ncbi:flagellar hook-length control protein FliK [Allohahella marinimesophila]|uniref:Flagellar hook-length control protein-like C-terminal domain-containing protein n=1 Tax=Allohahella marinimesophila TaxID=1054972 RepID=A0ABP7NLU5_9GAMM
MSIDNNIGSTPGGAYSGSRRSAGSTGDSGRASEAAKPSGDAGKARDVRQPSPDNTVNDVRKLPEGTRIDARIVSLTLADQQLQQTLQQRSQQAALLALRLQLTNQPMPGAAPREGATLTTTIRAGELSAALGGSSGSRSIPAATSSGEASTLQRLQKAVNAQPFLQLRVSGGRLELLSATALPASAQTHHDVTLQSQQQSLAKWMPLQADTRASLRALLDIALSAAPRTASASASASVPADAQPGSDPAALNVKLDKALAALTPPPVSQVRSQGFLQQHMQGSGQFMENRLATALAAATTSTQGDSPSRNEAPSGASTLRHFAMALKNALSSVNGDPGKSAGNALDARLQSGPPLHTGRQGDVSRPLETTPNTAPATPAPMSSLPPSDLKSAVIEALGLVLKLQTGGQPGSETRDGQLSAASGMAQPQTAAQLVRLLRAEILKTLDTPARLSGLTPDAQEQAAVSMLSRAALNSSKEDSDRDTGEILKHLARLLSRVQTNQLTSIQASHQADAELPGSQTLVLDLPFLHHQAEMVTVLMERYPTQGQHTGDTQEQRYGYRIVLDFNFDKNERITALKSHVRYTEGTVSAAFWTSSEHEAQIVASHLPHLRQELTRWGLTVGELSLQVGEAPPARQGVRKQILNERI